MKKNIWVLHHYATPPSMSGMTRPYELAKNLKGKGYNSKIFASAMLHYTGENLIDDKSRYIIHDEDGIPFIFVRSSEYKGNGLSRVKNMVSFSRNLMKVMKEFARREGYPDVILASSPHPLTVIVGIIMAKKFKIPCITEYRDLWPEAIFKFGRLKEHSIIGKLLIKGEHWMYKNSDAVIFLKEGDTEYIIDKKWNLEQDGDIDLKKCFYINNGVDIEEFNRKIEKYPLADNDLTSGKFNVIYTGAIRPVNNVANLLDTAKLLRDHDDIQFLIYGDGNQLDFLEKRAEKEGIKNVKMKGYINRKFIPYILSHSSVNILNYSGEKYNWSRGNSSNKLFEYMASGKPVISTVKMGYSIIEKYDCGYELAVDSPEELANAILKAKDLSIGDYSIMSDNAKLGAKEFDYIELSKKLENVINFVSEGKKYD